MSNKNARWGQTSSSPTVVLAGRAAEAHLMFGGKTLAAVGQEFDLADEDVKWGYGINPQTNEEYRSLVLSVGNRMFQIPLSRKVLPEHLENPDILLNCMFRTTFLAVKDEKGDVVYEEDGVTPKLGTEAYMSFGRPAGIVIERLENVFEAPAEVKAETIIAGAAAPKPAATTRRR